MKNLLTFFILIFGLSFPSAQKLVLPQDASTETIANYLQKVNYKIKEKTNTYLLVENDKGLDLYMDLVSNYGLNYNINLSLKDGVSREKIDHLVLKINELPFIKADYISEKNLLGLQYMFFIKRGFTYETLESAIAEFNNYRVYIYGLDNDKILQ